MRSVHSAQTPLVLLCLEACSLPVVHLKMRCELKGINYHALAVGVLETSVSHCISQQLISCFIEQCTPCSGLQTLCNWTKSVHFINGHWCPCSKRCRLASLHTTSHWEPWHHNIFFETFRFTHYSTCTYVDAVITKRPVSSRCSALTTTFQFGVWKRSKTQPRLCHHLPPTLMQTSHRDTKQAQLKKNLALLQY